MTATMIPGLMPGARERTVNFGDDYIQNRSGLYVPPRLTKKLRKARWGRRPLLIDLFAGAGGMSCGFHAAGWRTVAAVEFNATAAMTYMYNLGTYPAQFHFIEPKDGKNLERELTKHYTEMKRDDNGQVIGVEKGDPNDFRTGHGHIFHTVDYDYSRLNEEGCPHFWLGDIRKVSGSEILDTLGLEPGDIDCVCGGPPCQGFSTCGKREVMDPRNSLVFEFVRFVLEVQPQTMIMENVPGMVSMVTAQGVPVIDAVCHALEDGGWGSYEALMRSMEAQAGVGLLKKARKIGHDKDSDDSDPDVDVQGSLF